MIGLATVFHAIHIRSTIFSIWKLSRPPPSQPPGAFLCRCFSAQPSDPLSDKQFPLDYSTSPCRLAQVRPPTT